MASERTEVKILNFLKSVPEISTLTKGNIFQYFAPINTHGKTDTFVTINRYDTVPLDRTFADEVSWLRVKIEIVIYGRTYEKLSQTVAAIQRAMETEWPGASDGEIGLEPMELSNTVWVPFRLDYKIMEDVRNIN